MWNNLDGCEEWGICEDLESAREHLAQDIVAEERRSRPLFDLLLGPDPVRTFDD